LSTNVLQAAPHPVSFAGTAFAHDELPLPIAFALHDFALRTAAS